jgi:hypothetical protein
LRISGREVQFGVGQSRIQFDRFLEVVDRGFVLGVSESADAFVQIVASLKLGAADGPQSKQGEKS